MYQDCIIPKLGDYKNIDGIVLINKYDFGDCKNIEREIVKILKNKG